MKLKSISSSITATAVLNLKEQPAKIYIHGSVLTEREDDKVKFEIAEFQGINPTILLCDLHVISGKLPMKVSPKLFNGEYDDSHALDIKEVTIRKEGEDDYTIPLHTIG
jgi:hypothetical protein